MNDTIITDINQIAPLTASNISIYQMDPTNRYLVEIHAGANVMVERGRGLYRYQTHNSGGRTVWMSPDGVADVVSSDAAAAFIAAQKSKNSAND